MKAIFLLFKTGWLLTAAAAASSASAPSCHWIFRKKIRKSFIWSICDLQKAQPLKESFKRKQTAYVTLTIRASLSLRQRTLVSIKHVTTNLYTF